MSKYLPDIPPELDAAFRVFLAEHTEPAAMAYVTPVYALRAAFRAWTRVNAPAISKPSEAQVNWLLDDMNVPVEMIPARTGPRMPHACGLRLIGKAAK
ncbi:hypothetical protein ACFY91_07850 [Streptomyces albogriseolus]|uniref:hypothetical protein n=1 Tax=Streptomyces albogriseolus TaxID=1887 RepID=UPI0036E79CD0